MNRPNPEHTDPGHDDAPGAQDGAQLDAQLDALLAEDAERSRRAPAELEAKVLALTDARVLSLLDEALAPGEAPASLTDRIVAATSPVASTARRAEPAPRGVLARIGPTGWRYAAAAAVVLAAGLGMWWLGQTAEPNNPLARVAEPGGQTPDDFFASDEAQPLFDDATQDVQTKIQAVAERIDGYAIDRDSIWSDMDEYEQFVSELET